jgi:carboxyl-terminal processing protease
MLIFNRKKIISFTSRWANSGFVKHQFMFKSKKCKISKKVLIVIAFLVAIFISFGAGIYFSGRNEIVKKIATKEALYLGKLTGKYSEVPSGEISQDVDFEIFWDVWDKLQKNYVDQDKLSDKKMFYGALAGLVSSLEDPYTVFMNPKDAKDFDDDLAGTFEGIGAEIGIKDDILTIIAPLPDTPADKAGLRSGDKVYAIDGESTAGITIDEAVEKIRGPRGTDVVLSVFHEGDSGVHDVTITRGVIVVKSVYTETLDNNIFKIEVSNFNEDTKQLFDEAVLKILQNNPKGIILDLRHNPGGYLDTAIEMASEWVEDGAVVYEQYTDGYKLAHESRGRALLKDFETVVLVNQGSASASEIVSGALQDYDEATIIGRHTFGKGSVQSLVNLDDGSSIKITIAKWLTPDGRSINDEGVMPDFKVDLTKEDYEGDKDPQLEAAIEYLLGKDISKFVMAEEELN